MNKIFLSILLAVSSLTAFAGADDIVFTRRNSVDSGQNPFTPPHNTTGIAVPLYDSASPTTSPQWTVLGSGLTISAGVVTVDAPAFSAVTGKPTTLSGYGITDAYPLSGNPSGFLTGVTSGQVTSALGLTPVDQAGARVSISLATTGSGAATYNSGTGVLNVPTPAAASPFNFGAPAAKTVAVSTSYQAADPAKAAIVTISPNCQNVTTILASSACTLQVRQAASSVTCSTGTVVATWTATVQLGLALTQASGSPIDVKLPIGGAFILCPTAGTFTITTAVEQTAGS